MRKLLCVVPALLLASCHSQQVAFRFQPAPATSVPVASTPVETSPAEVSAAQGASTAATAAPSPAPAALPAKRLRPRQLLTTLKALPPSALASLAAAPEASKQARLRPRRHTTEGAAESGLGRVALFFIAVALGIVAGLGALLALIPGVSFWGGVGLAVAALVVLFLLYSLLKKK